MKKFVIVAFVLGSRVARADDEPPVEPPLPPVEPPPVVPVEPPPVVPVEPPHVEVAPLPSPPALVVPVKREDGFSRVHLGGILQFDGRFFVDDHPQLVDQFAFRSIRPDLQATLYEHFDVRILPDFAGGKLVVQEAYADVHYGDAVKLRAGKFKVPFGLERLQAEVATTFVERGFPTQLAPNRDLGVQIFGDIPHFEYQLGVFNGVADGQSGDGDVGRKKELAARVFVKPIGGLGFGGAMTYGYKLGTVASPDVAGYKTQGQNTFFAYRAGPAATASLADTVIADGLHWRATGQANYYAGPIGVMAEYVRSKQRIALDSAHTTAEFDAYQVLAQWVLTGDDATYKSVAPKHPFDPTRGQIGAIDIAARFTELRAVEGELFVDGFADLGKSAKRAYSAGGGADWFLNKSFRFALDLDHTWFRRGAVDGNRPAETSIIGRVQAAF